MIRLVRRGPVFLAIHNDDTAISFMGPFYLITYGLCYFKMTFYIDEWTSNMLI